MPSHDVATRGLVVLVAAAVIALAVAVTPLADTKASCSTAKDCKSCIAKSGCAWCIPANASMEAKCLQATNSKSCQGTVEDPASKLVSSSSQPPPADYTVDLTPRKVKVDLRVGASIEVPLVLDISKDQWLDLYYLTDISKSMEDDLKFLTRIGKELEEELSSLTAKFNIGFGTFIDKKMMPYFDEGSSYATSVPSDECHRTYGFCNALHLTANGGDAFNAAVRKAGVGSNTDIPEGGMDALLQVLVCTDAIGWRREARKLVLYASDADFHHAGDGKLAGIDKINDGKCHLDKGNRWYTDSTLQDYPSVSQIVNAAKSNDIYVIFAVTARHIKLYRELAKLVPGSKTAVLESDSSNIKDIIVEQFKNIVSSMKLVVDNPKDHLKVDFRYSCPNGNPASCEGLVAGARYNLTAIVTLLECPQDVTSQQVTISSTSLVNRVTLDLNFLCSCDCEKIPEQDSTKCADIGNFSCGQCSCPEGFSGNNCECSKNTLRGDAACIKPNATADVCSSRGECVCDKCVCTVIGDGTGDKYQGDYCECSNFECKKVGGELCGGHGRCDCSTCQCNDGWTGDDCSCSSSKDNCYKDGTLGEEVCSGHGQCECNSCKCNSELDQGHRYIGKHCHDCETCQSCETLEPCVTCHLTATEGGDSEEGDSLRCSSSKKCALADIVVRGASSIEQGDMSYCEKNLPDDCTRPFYFMTVNGNTTVIVSLKKTCPTPWWVILLSVIGAVVGVGLLSLVIYWLVNKHIDAKAMRAHDKTVATSMNQPVVNQMYRNPVSENMNPLYGRDQ